MCVRCTPPRASLNSTLSSVTDLSLKTRPATSQQSKAAATCGALAPPVDIEACGVAKGYAGTSVFSDVSFRLTRGETVAIVGANGTGKSTLLRCLMGLVPVDQGRIVLLNQDTETARPTTLRALRARVGFVSQTHNLVPRLSVLSNVVHGVLGRCPGPRHWSHQFAPRTSRVAAMSALEMVGLADLALRRADRLSGGQSQRVAIARALVGKPEILIADEPCASLDPAAGEDVMALFCSLARENGVTMVFTSHHVDHALRYGDRVLGLAQGRLRLDATAASLDVADLRGLYDH